MASGCSRVSRIDRDKSGSQGPRASGRSSARIYFAKAGTFIKSIIYVDTLLLRAGIVGPLFTAASSAKRSIVVASKEPAPWAFPRFTKAARKIRPPTWFVFLVATATHRANGLFAIFNCVLTPRRPCKRSGSIFVDRHLVCDHALLRLPTNNEDRAVSYYLLN